MRFSQSSPPFYAAAINQENLATGRVALATSGVKTAQDLRQEFHCVGGRPQAVFADMNNIDGISVQWSDVESDMRDTFMISLTGAGIGIVSVDLLVFGAYAGGRF